MHKYKLLGRKGEGTFSEVLKAQSLKTSRFMAIKCMKHVFESLEQVNSLREIQALRHLLEAVDLEGVLVQADALHANRPFSSPSPSAAPTS